MGVSDGYHSKSSKSYEVIQDGKSRIFGASSEIKLPGQMRFYIDEWHTVILHARAVMIYYPREAKGYSFGLVGPSVRHALFFDFVRL